MLDTTQSEIKRCALFDMDGTLIDAVENQKRGWYKWAANYGLNPEETYRVAVAMRPTDAFERLLPNVPVDDCLALLNDISDQDAAFGAYTAFDGAADLLRQLPLENWAVVTSNYEHRVRLYFERSGLPNPVVIVDAPAARAGKPAPDPYLLAAERLGVTPTACLVVEDAESGIQAGLAAGMTVWSVHTTEHNNLAHRHFDRLRDAIDPVLGFIKTGNTAATEIQ